MNKKETTEKGPKTKKGLKKKPKAAISYSDLNSRL